MNFEERCRLSEQCLPEAPYKEMLTKLHDEMLEALAQRKPPLTDEEHDKLMRGRSTLNYGRAVEAAHGIKGDA